MNCFYVGIMILGCIIHNIVGMHGEVKQPLLSLTERYLQLARVIESVEPFANLPIEIRKKITRYFLDDAMPIKIHYLPSNICYLFTHLIGGNYLIGRASDGSLSIGDLDNNIFSSRHDFKDADIQICQRMVDVNGKDNAVLIKTWHGYSYRIPLAEIRKMDGLFNGLFIGARFDLGADLIAHPKLPYCGSTILTSNHQRTVSIYHTDVFDGPPSPDIQPRYQHTIACDNTSQYPLLWHPSALKFLCKHNNILHEYDAKSGTCIRSFKTPDIAFDPFHIAYVAGGDYCISLHDNALYTLHAGKECERKKIKVAIVDSCLSREVFLHKILGVNKGGEYLLLDFFDAESRTIGVYDIKNDSIIESLSRLSTGQQSIIFDPATVMVAVVGDSDNQSFKECIRIKMHDIPLFNQNSSLKHLMCHRAQKVALHKEDQALLKNPLYSSLMQQTDAYCKKW